MIVEQFSDVITDLGSFEIHLDPELAPHDSTLEQIKEYDMFVVLPTWHQHPDSYLDADLLAVARYAGRILEPERSLREHVLRGQGMSHDLGDSLGVGPVIESPLTFASDDPSAVLAGTALLQYNITPGTITDTDAGTYTATDAHFGETQREALDVYLKTVGLHARVNPNGTLDACDTTRDDVFRVADKIVVATREGWGQDPGGYVGVQCNHMATRLDGKDVARRAIYIDQAAGTITASASLNLSYTAVNGDPLRRTVVVESLPEDVAASSYLSGELSARSAIIHVEIDADTSEAALGVLNAGDWLWVSDPESGIVDYNNQLTFRGSTLWPMAGRATTVEWPTMDGQGYYHRRGDQDPEGPAVWTDLTPFVVKEYKEGQSFSRLIVTVKREVSAPPCN